MMLVVIVFALGVGNFAMHRAVLESGHPLLAHAAWFFGSHGGRLSFAVEFAMLLGVMLMAASGSSGWAWFYTGYSVLNAVSAWLILSDKV